MTRKALLGCVLVLSLPGWALAQSGSSAADDVPFEWLTEGDFHPYLEVSLGRGNPDRKEFEGDFADYAQAELKIGFNEVVRLRSGVGKLDFRYLFGSYMTSDTDYFESSTDSVMMKGWRFGFGNQMGYGWVLKSVEILPYNQNSFYWTEPEFGRPESLSQHDSDILDRYEGSIHFGQIAEAGLHVRLVESLAVFGGYEMAVIYPRHVFLEWFVSVMLEYSLLSGISIFSERVIESSPLIGPPLDWILRNAVSYGFFSLRKENMNWPFSSEIPMTTETLKLGASITF